MLVVWAASPLVRHAHRHARMATCFAFLPTDFQGKERLLAVYYQAIWELVTLRARYKPVDNEELFALHLSKILKYIMQYPFINSDVLFTFKNI